MGETVKPQKRHAMKEMKEKTYRAIHWIICTLYLAAIVSIAGVLWTRYHDWTIVVFLAAAVAIGICHLAQGFDLSDALEIVSEQNKNLRLRAELIRKLLGITDKYDIAIVALYTELESIDPENERLKFVTDSLFGKEENVSEKISEK